MSVVYCPYLKCEIELTKEREGHIASHHPDLLPEHRQCIIDTVTDPDQVRQSARFGNARMFSRWFSDLRGGKYIVVVVVSDPEPGNRSWVITAYMTRKLAEGKIEWKRN